MLTLAPDLVAIHNDVLANPSASARVDRMLRRINCNDVREVDDAALAQLARERWAECGEVPNNGQLSCKPQPDADIAFTAWHFVPGSEKRRITPCGNTKPAPRALHGRSGLTWRDDGNPRNKLGSVCTSAWEFHSIWGCGFHCSYCSYGTGLVNVAANIEEQVSMLDEWTERNDFQTLYKWDNSTDISCFEPEYDATRLFVDYFRKRRHKYLLFYAGKSDNVDFMLNFDHGAKTITQWSLAAESQARAIEFGTASVAKRIEAAHKCQAAGYPIRFRFSPILPIRNWRKEYADLIRLIFEKTRPDVISLCFFGWMDISTMLSCVPEQLLDPWALDLARARPEETEGRLYGPFPHEVRYTVLRFLVDEIRRISPTTPVSLCLESREMWDIFANELGRMGDGFLCNCGPVCSPGTAFYESRQSFFAARG